MPRHDCRETEVKCKGVDGQIFYECDVCGRRYTYSNSEEFETDSSFVSRSSMRSSHHTNRKSGSDPTKNQNDQYFSPTKNKYANRFEEGNEYYSNEDEYDTNKENDHIEWDRQIQKKKSENVKRHVQRRHLKQKPSRNNNKNSLSYYKNRSDPTYSNINPRRQNNVPQRPPRRPIDWRNGYDNQNDISSDNENSLMPNSNNKDIEIRQRQKQNNIPKKLKSKTKTVNLYDNSVLNHVFPFNPDKSIINMTKSEQKVYLNSCKDLSSSFMTAYWDAKEQSKKNIVLDLISEENEEDNNTSNQDENEENGWI